MSVEESIGKKDVRDPFMLELVESVSLEHDLYSYQLFLEFFSSTKNTPNHQTNGTNITLED